MDEPKLRSERSTGSDDLHFSRNRKASKASPAERLPQPWLPCARETEGAGEERKREGGQGRRAWKGGKEGREDKTGKKEKKAEMSEAEDVCK